MANRRMFSNRIGNSAKFLQMPSESQLLYFHMILRADDDGVVESYPLMKLLGIPADVFKVLIAKGFIKQLNEDQVIVITDWLEHNIIRADRKVDSVYKQLLLDQGVPLLEPKARVDVEDNSRRLGGQSTDGISQVRLGKDNIEEDASLKFLDEIPKEVVKEMIVKFKCSEGEVVTKSRALADYCRAKGKRYKNYKALLGNSLRKDYGERPIEKPKIPQYDISSGVAVLVGYK